MFAARLAGALRRWSVPEVSRYLIILTRNRLGLTNRMNNADRLTLEEVIFPAYAAQEDIRSVLFVGCDWYTHHYDVYFPGRTYATLDPDPWKRKFGATQHHVAGLEAIEQFFAPGSLDLIVCNGVWGWGLDERKDCEQAFNGCYTCLRDGGHLMIGWNDLTGHRPMALESLASLGRFEAERFAPLGTSRYLANAQNRHIYDFYVKPAGG